MKGFEKVVGLDNILTLNLVGDLGNLYENQGKLKEAEKMYQRTLKGKEKATGLGHSSTLNIV